MEHALRAVAEPRRRAILRLVTAGERRAGEISDAFPEVTKSAVSQHLRVLKEAGLVNERRDGRYRFYRARTDRLHDIARWLDAYWDDRLQRLATLVEADARASKENEDE